VKVLSNKNKDGGEVQAKGVAAKRSLCTNGRHAGGKKQGTRSFPEKNKLKKQKAGIGKINTELFGKVQSKSSKYQIKRSQAREIGVPLEGGVELHLRKKLIRVGSWVEVPVAEGPCGVCLVWFVAHVINNLHCRVPGLGTSGGGRTIWERGMCVRWEKCGGGVCSICEGPTIRRGKLARTINPDCGGESRGGEVMPDRKGGNAKWGWQWKKKWWECRGRKVERGST